MSAENSCEQSIYSSTEASTPSSDTPSTSEIMSTTPTANLQMASPTYENMFRSFQDTFASLRAEITRLEIENKRLVEHNRVIEKELETLNEENVKLSGANDDAIKRLEIENKRLVEHNTVIEKELETLNEENVKLSEASDDAMKKLAQKEFSGMEGLKEVIGWKKRCEELDNRATENQERMEKMDKRIAEVQQQSQQNFEQAIDRMKDQQALDLKCVMTLMGLEDLKDGYIFRENPLNTIPNGMIQVSRAKVDIIYKPYQKEGPPREDKDSGFLYVVRDQYKDFNKFANLAESVFGLDEGHLQWLKVTNGDSCQTFIRMWKEQASQKDRIYILSGEFPYDSSTVYYVEE